VLHKPTGETWVVLYADYDSGYLMPMGWPQCEARIEDCGLVEKASESQRNKYANDLRVGSHPARKKALRLFEQQRSNPL